MQVIDSKIDLGTSFEKLIQALFHSDKEFGECPSSHILADLQGAVQTHIKECTGHVVNYSEADDLKDINI